MSESTTSDPTLPPVQPPSAGFLLQLFLIPMVIVLVIVAVWVMFSWLAHMGNDPTDLVTGIKKGRWQDAATLADLLRDPQKEHLRQDPALVQGLVSVLRELNESKKSNEERTKIKIFVCKALGEFHILDGVPSLVETVRLENDESDVEVRRYAVEALAVLASKSSVGREKLRNHDDVLPAVIEASQQRAESNDPGNHRANLRASAAFTLGVLGGDEALGRLERMLSDSFPNVRYNAATGLARNGDNRSIPELLAMLDPKNENVVRGEDEESHEWKRIVVLINGIRASRLLAENNSEEDLTELQTAIKLLTNSEVPRAVRLAAQETLAGWPDK